MDDERAREGWKAFCDMTGISERKAYRMKPDLEKCGAIFYMYRGRPPRKRLMFFPSIIKKYLGLKGLV